MLNISMKYKTRVYIHGLLAAIITSVSNAGYLVVIDPEDFNPIVGGSYAKLGGGMLLAALIAFFTYMREHPLPDPEKDVDAMSVARDKIADIREGTGN